jgi:hypothetical protein
MVKTLLRGFAPATLCASLLAAQAQTAPPTARPDPLDAQAPVPALVYRSSLVSSRPSGADKPVPWREANDTVARIGGWRAYAREAQAPASAPSAPSHSGHKTP